MRLADRDDSVNRQGAVGHARTSSSGQGTRRIVGLDVARALAIVGMLAVNIGPVDEGGFAGTLMRLPHGRASLLFVLLAGIGFALLTRHARSGAPVPWRSVLWRVVLLAGIGLTIQLLNHDVNVILTTYAALFAVGLIVVRAPAALVLALAVIMAVAGPVTYWALQAGSNVDVNGEASTVQDSPANILGATFLTGPYPVVTWVAPFLFGVWLGRRELRHRATQLRLLLIGTAVAIVAQLLSRALVSLADGEREAADLLAVAAHSQMPFWLIGGTAAAAAVLGACLLIAERLGRWAGPLIATGQLALTVYVAHLLILAVAVRPGPHDAATGLLIAVAMSAVLIAAATGWRRFFAQGPLEALLRPPFAAR